MYGDASLDAGVGYTGLVGQINGATVVWRSMRQSLGAFCTIETEAQALVDLMQMAEGHQDGSRHSDEILGSESHS